MQPMKLTILVELKLVIIHTLEHMDYRSVCFGVKGLPELLRRQDTGSIMQAVGVLKMQ